MRHRSKTKKLGRKTAHRKSLLSNLAVSLLKHKSIQTTTVKAKVLRSYIEKLITMAKKDSVAARRQVYSKVHSRDIVKILFDEVAPKFADREGGYTRITKIGFRRGDGAETALIELLLEKEEKKAKKSEKRAAGKKPAGKIAESKVDETKEETTKKKEKIKTLKEGTKIRDKEPEEAKSEKKIVEKATTTAIKEENPKEATQNGTEVKELKKDKAKSIIKPQENKKSEEKEK